MCSLYWAIEPRASCMLRKGPRLVCLSPASEEGIEEPIVLEGDTHVKGVCAVGRAATQEVRRAASVRDRT